MVGTGKVMNIKKHVYQFKIELKEIKPAIWRRIVVPATYSFWDLHVAIQDSMGWLDSHLHVFRIANPNTGNIDEIGIPDDELIYQPGWELRIGDYFIQPGDQCEYEYDFGDSWEHEVVLEGVLLKAPRVKYPKCIGGARACPPEDCGGVHGYQEMLKIIRSPSHEEHESMMEWLGGKYDPKAFYADNVHFDSPGKRWRIAFMNEEE
jgi:hypothetical protein